MHDKVACAKRMNIVYKCQIHGKCHAQLQGFDVFQLFRSVLYDPLLFGILTGSASAHNFYSLANIQGSKRIQSGSLAPVPIWV